MRFRSPAPGQAWRETWAIFAVTASRLALILGVVVIEDIFNWAVVQANRLFTISGGVTIGDLGSLLRYMVDALDISVLVAVIVLAAADILAVLLSTGLGTKAQDRSSNGR
jgi:hypothetical protein